MSPDPSTEQAMNRLRAADPAADLKPLQLTATDVIGSGDSGTDNNRVDPDGLVDAAPSRRRIRWLVPLVAAAVALLVVGGALLQNVWGSGDGPVAGVPVSPVQVAANCEVDGEPSDAPPTKAVSVSLCDRSENGLNLVSPPDALVDDIDQLIAVFDQLERPPGDMSCTADMGPRYALVFTEADGTTTFVEGELYGCGQVGERLGASTYLAEFTQLLLTQRTDRGPWVGDVAAASCETISWIIPTPELADRGGLLCVPGSLPIVTVPIGGDDLATLRDDLIAHSTSGTDGAPGCEDRVVLVLTDGYGDQLLVDINCGVGTWYTEIRSGEPQIWTLSPEATEIIQRLTGV